MHNISELMACLTGELESRVRTNITNNWPATPTAIIYSGETSYEAHQEIVSTLRCVWRGRSEAICQMVVRDGVYCLPVADGRWEPLEEYQVQEQIDELFSKEQSFRSMNSLLLVMVQNTLAYETVEQFAKDYLALDTLQEELGIAACSTMKIVLLDESGKCRALAQQIRAYLRQMMEDNNPCSKSTVILSNRLKNGVLLTGRRIRENYALAGNMILLANNSNNSSGKTYTPKYSLMFPLENPNFISASYTRDSKPNEAICEVLINAVLSWLEAKLSQGELLSTDMMSQRLGITGGTMKSLEQFYKQQAANILPPLEVLDYLPRVSVRLDAINNLPFKEYDRMTMGAFQTFYDNTVTESLGAAGLKRQFREYFAKHIHGVFTPKEAAKSIKVQTVEQILSQLRKEEPSQSLPASRYLSEKAKADYYTHMLPICEEVLLEICATAQADIHQISEISEEFQHSYMLNIDVTVQDYYHKLAMEKLNGDFGEQLMAQLDEANLNKADILDILEQAIKTIFASHAVFGMSMVKELIARMGGNANMVQTIMRELTDDLGDSIRLQTAIVPELKGKTMLVDQSEEDFLEILTTIFSKADCFDTGNSNGVEFVQLYSVDPQTL